MIDQSRFRLSESTRLYGQYSDSRVGGLQIKSIGLLGNDGGKLSEICDHSIVIKSNITSRIQEAHIFIGHLVCESVDDIREY